ncbi:lytic transglycosylase domain-containing protein [Clostridium sp. SHJSY1]|uniref:lytic transglycosylase domain-containing protein n=1 Tax=Clostridium sp. SHJSY1 TaxID=2942483 RepID=UPI002876EAEA|nr:lytic transglycosylase domain-containing protein [Clostridium sp. SHJSY1]MDS0526056.1 lytic transglycosylase domain-containing protein [Clostridium sp. SHJSY1]
MGIKIDDANKAAQQLMQMKLMENVLQKSVGDGMEFEIIYQALVDYMTKTEDGGKLGNTINNSNGKDLQAMEQLLGNGLKYNANASTSRLVSESSSTGGSDSNKIYSIVDKYSKQYGVDSKLILSIIKAESNFDPNAGSSAGAQGLMQLMPENSRAMGVTNPYDPDQNIKAGVQLFKEYIDMYHGNTEMAVAAYNAGPGTLQRRGVTSGADLYKLPKETQNYVPKVMSYYRNGI